MYHHKANRQAAGFLLFLLLAGCRADRAGAGPDAVPSASTSRSAAVSGAGPSVAAGSAEVSAPGPTVDTHGVPIGIPGPTDVVVHTINPQGSDPYHGDTGTLRGTVHIAGDPPPDTGYRLPEKCAPAQAMYGKLFRVGPRGALADALVAVTGYEGFVPASGPAIKATLRDCALNRRTYGVTFGQRIEVSNGDKALREVYMPTLGGSGSPTVLVALPGGDPVKLYPMAPLVSHYVMRDQMRSTYFADVFVVRYATFDVTGLDGTYEIRGIPVGKVHVNVLLPVLSKTDQRDIEIKAGDNTVDFLLTFDAKKDRPSAQAPAPSASAASSAR